MLPLLCASTQQCKASSLYQSPSGVSLQLYLGFGGSIFLLREERASQSAVRRYLQLSVCALVVIKGTDVRLNPLLRV